MIDKRFYRRPSDAARAIDAFTLTLREVIDLDQLSERLLAVVQPQTLSFWLDHRNPIQYESSSASTLARWRQNGRQHAEHTGELLVSSEPAAESPAVTGPLEMNIPHDDPLVAYVLNTAGIVEIDRLHLDSPVLGTLQAAQVKLALPFVSQGELIGWLNLGPRLDEHEYALYERRLLTTLASQVAPALRVAQMVHEQHVLLRERERVEQELRTAQFIQQAFLPKEVPTLPAWQLAHYYQPAREVGGDFYDFLSLADGQVGLVIGDVTDKGVPAALVMTTTCTILWATGMPLGMMPGSSYEEHEVTLAPGENVLFYSDGLVEAHNSTHAMFGLPHLKELLGTHPGGTALVDYLRNELASFTGPNWEQEDDVTLVVLCRSS